MRYERYSTSYSSSGIENSKIFSSVLEGTLLIKRIYNVVMTVISWIFALVVFSILGIAIYQSITAKPIPPSPKIIKLAKHLNLTEKGKKLLFNCKVKFFEDKNTVQRICKKHKNAFSAGCFLLSRNEIIVFDNTDQRFQGLTEMTIAHELLHSAYEGLSSPEKKFIDNEIENHQLTHELKKRMEVYGHDRKTLLNEFHSILATEITHLSPSLETYYSQYFTDRNKIISYYEKSNQILNKQEENIKFADRQIDDMNKKISTIKDNIEKTKNNISKLEKSLKLLAPADDNKTYNSLVQTINEKIKHGNMLVKSYNELIENYKNQIQERNSLVQKSNQTKKFFINTDV